MTSRGRLPRLTPEDAPANFPTLGWQLLHWWETFLRHGPGPVFGSRWIDDPDEEPGLGIDDEEALHILWCYRLDPETGRRVFRRVTRVRPKGRRKSEIAGGLCVLEALAPVRFDHWAARGETSWWGYEYEQGEPVGRPVLYPEIVALATEENQTGNTYDNVYEMLGGAEIRDAYPGVDRGLTRSNLPSGGFIAPTTGAADSKEGGGQTFGVADEIYLWIGERLARQHHMVTRNLGKTARLNEGWLYETSNAHSVGKNSVLERAYESALKLGSLDAMVRAGHLFDWLEPTDPLVGDDYKDDKKVLGALRGLYGPAGEWMDLGRVISEIRDPETTEDEGRRAWLNQASTGGSAWLDLGVVKSLTRDLEKKPWRLRPGMPLAAGFDGSRFSDSTAIMVATEGGILTPWRIWEKTANDGDDWEVDEDEVEAAWDELFETHPIARFLGDPFLWETNLAKCRRRNGNAVREFRTNRDREMAIATHEFEIAVRTGAVEFVDPDGVILKHFGNTHVREVTAIIAPPNKRGHVPVKERKGSPNKIDVSPASILTWRARTEAIARNEFKTARRVRRRSGRMRALSK